MNHVLWAFADTETPTRWEKLTVCCPQAHRPQRDWNRKVNEPDLNHQPVGRMSMSWLCTATPHSSCLKKPFPESYQGDSLLGTCNEHCTFLNHDPVPVDWLYCMQVSGSKFGSGVRGPRWREKNVVVMHSGKVSCDGVSHMWEVCKCL